MYFHLTYHVSAEEGLENNVDSFTHNDQKFKENEQKNEKKY